MTGDTDIESMPAEGRVEPADWEARAAHIRQALGDAVSPTTLVEVLGSFRFLDDDGLTWTYNGASWLSWNGQAWVEGSPEEQLRLQPFRPEAVAEAEEEEAGRASAEAAISGEPATAQPAGGDVAGAEAAAAEAPGAGAASDRGTVEPTIGRDESARPAESASTTSGPWTPAGQAGSTSGPSWSSQRGGAEVAAQPGASQHSGWGAQASRTESPTTSGQPTQQAGQPTQQAGQPTEQAGASDQPTGWPAPTGQPAATPQYRPTHAVPAPGIPAWSRPDPTISPEFRLWAGLDVMVVEWLPSGWARIVTSNQWSGWVDGRVLVPYR
ncbi:MAG: hypothetical protein M3N29_10955 [Chloroflexota bacterium]|nr:hypothetical protein [Chloroflexota bacterium]